MKTLNNISLLFEAINFENSNDVLTAIKNNKIGSKINKEFKELNGNTEATVRRALDLFFNKCENLKIQNKVYGVQFLLAKTTDINIYTAVKNDGLYEFLKSSKKDWVKNLDIYKEVLDNPFDNSLWHKFEKEIQEQSVNHGKANKGSGTSKSNCEKYNDGNWSLEIPNSFEEGKAISFYYDKGVKKPTHWCTRADKSYYDNYTQGGKSHLYVIKNLKTGRAYQLAFMGYSVEFLDDQDEKGDEVTTGDLSKIPNDLLKLIKDENVKNGRTLLDFKLKNEKEKPTNKHIKGEAFNVYNNNSKPQLGPSKQVKDHIYVRRVKNFKRPFSKDGLSNFFKTKEGQYASKTTLVKADYLLAFYDDRYPEKYVYFDPKLKNKIYQNPDLDSKVFREIYSTAIKYSGVDKRASKHRDQEEENNKVFMNERKLYDYFNEKLEDVKEEVSDHLGITVKYIDVLNQKGHTIGSFELESIAMKPIQMRLGTNSGTFRIVFANDKNISTYKTATYCIVNTSVPVNNIKKTNNIYNKGDKEFDFWINIMKKAVDIITKDDIIKKRIEHVKGVRSQEKNNKNPIYEGYFNY